MNKILLSLFFLLSFFISNAQIFGYGFLNVPEDEIQNFIQNEEEFFSKVAREAIKNKHMTGWSIWRRVEGSANEPNFYWYVGLGEFDNFTKFNENYSAAYQKVINKTGVPGLVERALEKHSSYHTFTGTYYRGGMARNKKSGDLKYLKANYAKVENPQAFMQKQNEVWKPFIEKNMNNGKAKQELWATSMRINPSGNGYNWNVMTIDAHSSIGDLYNPFDGKWEELNPPSQKELSETNPKNGWYKTTIWERVLWIDNDGNLMKK